MCAHVCLCDALFEGGPRLFLPSSLYELLLKRAVSFCASLRSCTCLHFALGWDGL